MSVSIDSSPSVVPHTAAANPLATVENEQLAREAVDFARKEVAEGLQCEREAYRLAGEANKRAAQAWESARRKRQALEDGGPRTPEEQAALEQEAEAAHREAFAEQQDAQAAEALAAEWQGWRAGAEERLAEAQRSANEVLKALGKRAEYDVSKPIHDTFARRGNELLLELARLLGAPASAPARRGGSQDARRVAVATHANPANGARLLAQLLEERDEPAYRQALVEDALPEAERMGADLSELLAVTGDDEALAHDVGCALLASLSRCAEVLGAAQAWPLAEAFARGFRDGHPGGKLAAWLEESLAQGPVDLCFAVELASALYASGKVAAADEVVTAAHRALAQGRELFVQLSADADALDATLTARLPELAHGRGAEELEAALRDLRSQHLEAFETREEAAGTLGAMLNGAALALAFARASGLPTNENTGSLLQEAVLALGLTARLMARTARGQKLLGKALDAQAANERAFLDGIPDSTRVLSAFQAQSPEVLAGAGLSPEAFAAGGEGFLDGARQALAQSVVPQLLALRSAGKQPEALGLLWTAVGKNPVLFGLGAPEATNACRALMAIACATRPFDLRRALGMLQRLNAGAAGGDMLRGLGVVVALSNLTVTPPAQARPLADVLRICSRNLALGPRALRALCCVFGPLCPTPTVAKLLGAADANAVDALGAGRARVLEAFGAVLGAMVAPTEPAGFGKPLAPAVPLPRGFAELLAIASTPERVEVLVAGFLRGLEATPGARAADARRLGVVGGE